MSLDLTEPSIAAIMAHVPVVGTSSGNVPSIPIPLSSMDQDSVSTYIATAISGKFTIPAGTTLQYVRGDGSLATSVVLSTVATSGAYSDLSGKPSIGTQVSVDTGWTANNTAGDKTAALSSYSNGLNGTMVTALNVVSGGTGTALSAAMDVIVVLVKKVAALETVLVASKLPNA